MQRVWSGIQLKSRNRWKASDRVRREFAVLGTALFLLLAPGILAGLVPWWLSRWCVKAPFLGFITIRAVGFLLIGAGIPVLLESFGRFALQGVGTPAPVFPTQQILPLRPKPDVPSSRIGDTGPGFASGGGPHSRVCNFGLVGDASICPYL